MEKGGVEVYIAPNNLQYGMMLGVCYYHLQTTDYLPLI